jgi:hypothetical protein
MSASRMQSLKRFAAVGLGLAIALALALPTIAIPNPPPDYYPFPLNGVWEYTTTQAAQATTGSLRIKVITADRQTDGTRYTTEQDLGFGPSNLVYLKGNGWVKELKFVLSRNGTSTETVNEPSKPILKNPPSVGDRWSWEGQQTGPVKISASESYSVGATETVEVPAGKFSAARIDISGNKAGTTFRKTFWYVNHIGPVKWQIFDANNALQTTTELKKYEFPK